MITETELTDYETIVLATLRSPFRRKTIERVHPRMDRTNRSRDTSLYPPCGISFWSSIPFGVRRRIDAALEWRLFQPLLQMHVETDWVCPSVVGRCSVSSLETWSIRTTPFALLRVVPPSAFKRMRDLQSNAVKLHAFVFL